MRTETDKDGATHIWYELRGANDAGFHSIAPEMILSGPSDTGKTWALCLKIHNACIKTAKCQVLLVRKNYNSLVGTVVKTLQRIIEGCAVKNAKGEFMPAVRQFGGEHPSEFIYYNGSKIWLGGMDNPDACLSAERDIIYVNQAEELTLNDWEMLSSRCTGRGAVVEHAQLIGDCNPSGKRHWILEREAQGRLVLLKSTHYDNPDLFDANRNITAAGVMRLERLKGSLSGVRLDRFFKGLWASVEGAVFPMFNTEIHVKERAESEMSEWFLCQDEGFTNPAVILLVGKDYDGRWHVFREYYKRGVLEVDVVKTAAAWFREKQCTCDAVDEAGAGLIAALINNGVNAMPGKGKRMEGIYSLQNRLKVCDDGKPRLTIYSECKDTINEFESHVFKPGTDMPLDADNHCFIAGTTILTRTGLKPIEKIQAGDFVWSPLGWNRVWKSSCTGEHEVKDYGAFTCTSDHQILTHRGIISLDALRYLDYIVIWQKTRKWSLTECLTGAILSPREKATGFISKALAVKARMAARHTCTVLCGNSLMGRFQMGLKCITRTAILSITSLIISSLSRILNMQSDTIGESGKVQKNTLPSSFQSWQNEPEKLQLHQKDTPGLLSKVRNLGKINLSLRSLVKHAARNTQHPSLVAAGTVISIAKCEPCENGLIQTSSHTSHAVTSTRAQTYNLNTSKGCYFANGVLVGNSISALRYLEDVLGTGTGAFSNSSVIQSSGPSAPGSRVFVPRQFTPMHSR